MKSIIFLSLLMQMAYGVNYFQTGTVGVNTPVNCTPMSCSSLNFEYINPYDTAFDYEVAFKSQDSSFDIIFNNYDASTLKISLTPLSVTISSPSGLSYTKLITAGLSASSTNTLLLRHKPTLHGSILQLSISRDNQIVFQTDEVLSSFSYVNSLQLLMKEVAGGGDGESVGAFLVVQSHSLSVSASSAQQKVVVIPMY